MSEELIKEDSNCIIKAFENNNITIIKEEPNRYLFKASEIGKILDLTNIRMSIQNFDEDEKCVRKAYTVRGDKDMIFLTSRGVYRLLYNSKKPEAKRFRKWVGDILDDIIFNNSIELNKQLKEKEEQLQLKTIENIDNKQRILLDSYHKKCIVYLIKIVGTLYKFGWSDNIEQRLKDHKRDISNDIQLIYCIESKNNKLLETKLKEFLEGTTYRLSKVFNKKNQTELIEIDDISIIKQQLILLNNDIAFDKNLLILENEKFKNDYEVLKQELKTLKKENFVLEEKYLFLKKNNEDLKEDRELIIKNSDTNKKKYLLEISILKLKINDLKNGGIGKEDPVPEYTEDTLDDIPWFFKEDFNNSEEHKKIFEEWLKIHIIRDDNSFLVPSELSRKFLGYNSIAPTLLEQLRLYTQEYINTTFLGKRFKYNRHTINGKRVYSWENLKLI